MPLFRQIRGTIFHIWDRLIRSFVCDRKHDTDIKIIFCPTIPTHEIVTLPPFFFNQYIVEMVFTVRVQSRIAIICGRNDIKNGTTNSFVYLYRVGRVDTKVVRL